MPFVSTVCFIMDWRTFEDEIVTERHRDTPDRARIALDRVSSFPVEKLGI